jgi:hypothetical protein
LVRQGKQQGKHDNVLSTAAEALDRRYALGALGWDDASKKEFPFNTENDRTAPRILSHGICSWGFFV